MGRVISEDPVAGVGSRSEQLLERAKHSVVGGDSSNMRVLPYHPPLVIDRGKGCRIWDVDGNEYFDLNMAYGPLLYGHRPAFLIERVVEQLQEKGSQLGFPQELNYLAAEKIKQFFPSIELLRFANSGTEAVASAVRVARVFTGRPNILLFEGHYHGWSDAVFHKYHAPLESLGDESVRVAIPGTQGMQGAPYSAFVVPWNDAEALSETLESLKGSVAAIIMEPVMGNAGVIPPVPGYLQQVRNLTREHGALLIFDEVITGFRVGPGGSQGLYGIRPDITVLSKALGGGFPIAAFGASAEIMEPIRTGELFHGGVYSGNALVLSAANAVLDHLIANGSGIYAQLNSCSDALASGLHESLSRRGIDHVVQHVGPMLSVILTRTSVEKLSSYRDVRNYMDFDKYIRFTRALLDCAIYVHPNQFEPMYLSTAHTREDIDEILQRVDTAVRNFGN